MDFQITNYSIFELLQILDIPERPFYDKHTFSEAIIRMVGCTSKQEENSKTKEDIVRFLVEAYHKLCDYYKVPLSDSELKDFIVQATNATKSKKSIEDIEYETEASQLIISADGKPKKIKDSSFLAQSPKSSVTPIVFKQKPVQKLFVFNSKFRNADIKNLIDRPLQNTSTDNYIENSRTTVTNSSTNFEIKLSEPITDVTKMQFKSIEYLNSMYTINKRNNTFFMRPTGPSDLDLCGNPLPWFQIVIPPGNYFITEQFNNSLQTQINDYLYNEIKTNPLCDCNETLFKITINRKVEQNIMSIARTDSTEPFEIFFASSLIDLYSDVPIAIESIFKTVGYSFGFRKTLYFGNNAYEAESIFETQGTRNIYFYIEDDANSTSQTNNLMLMLPNGSFMSENVLAKISSYVSSNSMQYENDADNIYRKREYISPVKLTTFKIKLLDDNGDVIDNNNTDFSFTLEFTIDQNKRS